MYFAQTSETDQLQIFKETLDSASSWINNNIGVVVHILIILFIAWLVVKVGSGLLTNTLKKTIRRDMYPTKTDRDKRISTLNSISNAVLRFTVYTVAGFTIMSAIGINMAPVLASAGIIGVALGFGTQSLVKDFISGLFIIIENQYRVGDFIEVQNVSGVVESITMRTTVLRGVDGSVHCVPNGSIVVSTNKTMGAGHMVLDVTFASDVNLEMVEDTINRVGDLMLKDKKLESIITEQPHFVRVSEFTDKGVIVKVVGTTASGKQLEVKSAFLSLLKDELLKEDIKVISALSQKAK